ncbi:hypothetical protein BDV30DRAFT_6717 [Aspergillus minisclerotigenes]|uniref:Uncharacterized protein n=1 Tax=Aspergillus minisclerotigenes TaxID=656917 RepID=A0A5N6JEK5_9EURO|nr:hypothetical protein BDV30DRAFT_6717 [Aspergillus minisclerotigenes]
MANTKDSTPYDTALGAVSTDNLNQPKRVILQHRANDFDDWSGEDYHSVIRVYAALSGRPVDEFDFDRKFHYTHAQTPLAAVRGFFYMTLDLHKDLLRNPDMSQVQHKLYRVCRAEDGTISLGKFHDPVKEQNLLRKIRYFSDTLRWGD